MKNIIASLFFATFLFSCTAQDEQFSQIAKASKFQDLENRTLAFADILGKYEGKVILIDVWASWCPDCIKGMTALNEIQEQNPEVTYLFLSVDKNLDAWKAGIERFNVNGEHYFIPDGMKGEFGKAINLSWIPRYILIDKTGKVVYYNATEASDKKLIEMLNNLK